MIWRRRFSPRPSRSTSSPTPPGPRNSSTLATTISTSHPSFASDDVARRLAAVRLRIERAGGDPSSVRVVGVTKGFGADAVHAAVEAGLVDIGENYAAEL